MMINRSLALIAALSLLGACTPVRVTQTPTAQPTAAKAVQLSIETYTAPEEQSLVNSHLITSDKELIVVDGQLGLHSALGLIDKIKATQKTPKAFILTHAHPDHYLGFHALQKAFPKVKLYATPGVKADFEQTAKATMDSLKGVLGIEAPDGLATVTELNGDLELGGNEIGVMEIKGGEHGVSAWVNVPSLKAVITGDNLYNQVHMFTKGCDVDIWLQRLQYMKKNDAGQTYYPGHGASNGGVEIIDANIDYLNSYKTEVAAATGNSLEAVVADAKKRLLAKFPNHKAPQLIDYSLTDYVKCTHPIGKATPTPAASAATSQLTIDTFTAPEAGGMVNSYLIQNDKELIVVDGQLTVQDAQSLVEKIKATKKTPKAFVLTHAHPDHYFGFYVLQNAFPGTKIYATAAVKADFEQSASGTLAAYKGMLGPAAPEGVATLTAYTEPLILGGNAIELIDLKGGEHTVSTYVRIPAIKAIIAGDTIYNQVHMFMKGCDADTWINQLQSFKTLDAGMTYYPGHGSGSGGISLIDANIDYIKGFKAEVASATGATVDAVVADAKKRVLAKFPTHKAPQLIDYALTDYVKCAHPVAKASPTN